MKTARNNRKRHPPKPRPPQARHGRAPVEVAEVMVNLRDLPTISREDLPRVQAYLEHQRAAHPEWWAAQSLPHLINLGQVFGVMYAGN